MFIYNHKFVPTNGICRAGVIPFTIKDNRLYFLLGIDRKTRELTDFGGGAKSNETMVQAGFRELMEESCEIFAGNVSIKNLLNSPAILNEAKNAIIFFLKIDSTWLNFAEQKFAKNQQIFSDISKHNELIGIKWVEDKYFREIAFNRKNQCMWRRVQNILISSTNWIELRLALLIGSEVNNILDNSIFNKYRGQYDIAVQ